MRRLEDLQALAPDWDSYGAVAISAAAIETCKKIEYVPLADGGIQIELHAGGCDTEVEVGPDGTVRSVLWERTGE